MLALILGEEVHYPWFGKGACSYRFTDRHRPCQLFSPIRASVCKHPDLCFPHVFG